MGSPLTYAYKCTVSPVTGFSPYFLMFGRTPKLPLDVDLGIPVVGKEPTSHRNYAQKLHSKLQWAYQKAQDNNQRESQHHKRYYDQRMRCIKLKPDDLVMVRRKALTGDHKIANRWEDTPHRVIDQLGDQPVFKVQPINATPDSNIRVLHRNMLFPLKTSEETNPKELENVQNITLMKANLLMDIHFNNETS